MKELQGKHGKNDPDKEGEETTRRRSLGVQEKGGGKKRGWKG